MNGRRELTLGAPIAPRAGLGELRQEPSRCRISPTTLNVACRGLNTAKPVLPVNPSSLISATSLRRGFRPSEGLHSRFVEPQFCFHPVHHPREAEFRYTQQVPFTPVGWNCKPLPPKGGGIFDRQNEEFSIGIDTHARHSIRPVCELISFIALFDIMRSPVFLSCDCF